MPEIKNQFTGGKMNKDVDERLVPNGEYRDAMNIQVSTSEGSDVGTVQNILGNKLINDFKFNNNNDFYEVISPHHVCIGSITDEKNDALYWFVAGPKNKDVEDLGPIGNNSNDPVANLFPNYHADYILKKDKDGQIQPIFVDVMFKDNLSTQVNPLVDIDGNLTTVQFSIGSSVFRVGDVVTHLGFGPYAAYNLSIDVVDVSTTMVTLDFTGQWQGTLDEGRVSFVTDLMTSSSAVRLVMENPSALELDHTGSLTAINIIDDILLWTDGKTEPKKINITRCDRGTSSGGMVSTNLIVQGSNKGRMKLEHTTVIKRAPSQAPTLDGLTSMRSGITQGLTTTPTTFNNNQNILFEEGHEFYVYINNIGAERPNLKVNDVLRLMEDGSILYPPENYNIRLTIIKTYSASINNTTKLKVRITTMSSETIIGSAVYNVALEEQGRVLFERKFPRFAYRYKYEDNEYSSIGPFSDVAFIPGSFSYHPTEAYNKGMVNNLKELTLKDFVPLDMPEDVVEVQLLYKNETSPTVYIVTSLDKTDTAWKASGSEMPPYNLVSNGGFETDDNWEVYGGTGDPNSYNPTIPPFVFNSGSVTCTDDGWGYMSIDAPGIIEGLKYRITYTVMVASLGTLILANHTTDASTLNSISSSDNVFLANEDITGVHSIEWYQGPTNAGKIVLYNDVVYSGTISSIVVERWAGGTGEFLPIGDNGSYNITTENLQAELEIQQTLRPWDNVPKNAVAQEVVGNRVVYGNYTQGYDLVIGESLGSSKVSPSFETILKPRPNVSYSQGGLKSIKSLRTYNFGIVYGDEYGRESPVFTHASANQIVTKESAVNSNLFQLTVKSPHPHWAKYYKVFIKETADTYYNLAMDRLYDAGDGNAWISFPSVDRNKVDEDTYLILKKGVDGGVEVSEEARYKIVAIENEAPDYIKTSYGLLGEPNQNMDGWKILGYDSATTFSNPQEAPSPGHSSFTISKKAWSDAWAQDVSMGLPNILEDMWLNIGSDKLYVVFSNMQSDGAATPVFSKRVSGRYLVVGVDIDTSLNDDLYVIKLSYKISNADAWITATLDEDYEDNGQFRPHFFRQQVKNDPEFDGRFFVKILDDAIVQEKLKTVVNSSREWKTNESTQLYRIADTGAPGVVNPTTLVTSSKTKSQWAQLLKFGNASTRGRWFIDEASYAGRQPGSNQNTNNSIISDGPGNNSGNNTPQSTNIQYWRQWWELDTDGDCNISMNEYFYTTYDWGNIGDGMSNGNVWSEGAHSTSSGNTTYYHLHLSYSELKPSPTSVTGISTAGNWSVGEDEGVNTGTDEMEDVVKGLEIGKFFKFKNDLNVYRITGSYPERLYNFMGQNPYTYIIGDNSFIPSYDSSNAIIPGGNMGDPSYHPGVTCPGINYYITSPSDVGMPSMLQAEAMTQKINRRKRWTITYVLEEGTEEDISQLAKFQQLGTTTPVEMEFVEPYSVEAVNLISSNPAVFETEPNEGVDLDLYYEATGRIPTSSIVQPIDLDWYNCWSFNNGVESNRVGDTYNKPYVTNGAKVSTISLEPYAEEHRKYGLIYSGIYNSISGVNNLNQFIAAEKITKDINPTYGSIQKLHTRDADLVTLCEDKVLKILANKDALFNADGNAQLTATERVLGQAIPFAGEYGISKNPESFASESYRVYFTDKVRGSVMRLSMDGLTPISNHGMKDWFRDNLKLSTKIVGSYDDKKDEYNITLSPANQQTYTVQHSLVVKSTAVTLMPSVYVV